MFDLIRTGKPQTIENLPKRQWGRTRARDRSRASLGFERGSSFNSWSNAQRKLIRVLETYVQTNRKELVKIKLPSHAPSNPRQLLSDTCNPFVKFVISVL